MALLRLIVFALAIKSAAQTTQVQTSIYLKELIGKIEDSSGQDIGSLLIGTPKPMPIVANGEIANWKSFSASQDVDFGYAVIDRSGDPIDLFGPDTPVVFSADNSIVQEIKGYSTPEDAKIRLVGKIEYDKVQKQLIDEMRDMSKAQEPE